MPTEVTREVVEGEEEAAVVGLLATSTSSSPSNNNEATTSSFCSTSTSVIARHNDTTANNNENNDNDSEEDEDSMTASNYNLIIGTSLRPLLKMRTQSRNNNNNNDYDENGNNSEDGRSEDNNCTTTITTATGRCWSCFIHLNNDNNSIAANNDSSNANKVYSAYTTHGHPLLSIPICSVCNDRAECVESHIIDVKLSNREELVDNVDGTTATTEGRGDNNNKEYEVHACSWCGLQTADYYSDTSSENSSTTMKSPSNKSSSNKVIIGGVPNQTTSSQLYLDDIQLGDNGSNELLLCDNCPRGMCVKCVTVGYGGHLRGLQCVRQLCKGGQGDGEGGEGEEWKCCYCKPTEFLECLRKEYRLVCNEREDCSHSDDDDGAGGGQEGRERDDDDVQSSNMEEDDDDDEDVKTARLIDELTKTENALSNAQTMLSKKEIEQTRHEIELELSSQTNNNNIGLEDLELAVEDELSDYLQRWQREFDLHEDMKVRLQEELESRGVQVCQFYKFREEERRRFREEDESEDEDGDYAARAEIELYKRDEMEGWSKGEFRGASGYKCTNAKVYKLEPEDLDNSNLNEIEDINTLEGQVSQMTSNSKRELNPWRGRTGTTLDDVEMLKKKSVKCEQRDLGGLIDLDKLEENCIREDDDIVEEDKVEMVIRSKKRGAGGGSRVVKQSTTLFVRKKQAAKSKRRGRLSGDNKEYQPRPPPQQPKQPVPAKAKKRAQLLPMSSSGTLSGRTSPAMKGVLMGSELATYAHSDVILEVAGCESQQVSVCHSLACMLKEHQKEGLQYCWKNICHDILNADAELYDGVRGAILAHNMGLGKSFQAVCLLHTLLTHPSLVRSSSDGVVPTSSNSKRIVHRAMLIAPVNTLANWEQEFAKWMGPGVPGVRFYSWTEFQSKSKIIKEWYEEGGILCCSSDRYANACKGFLEDKDEKKEAAKAPPTKEDKFFCEALLNPGPDIVVLDEVHTMLKTPTSNISKVLNAMGTKLRLALTGSPIQNNLYEYYRMASWIRPNSLGTEASYTKDFVVPIMDGMAADCTIYQAELQEIRSRQLHGILLDFVHRRDDAVLQKELPFHQSVTIHVRQSKVQVKLYQDFRKWQKRTGNMGFFKQYHALRPVSNHPASLVGTDENTSRPTSPTESAEEIAKSEEKAKAEHEGAENEEKAKAEHADLQDQPRVAPEKHAWICDVCNKAKFRTFDEAVEHEKTCNGVDESEETANKVEKGNAAKDVEWWRPFAEKAKTNDLDINALENGGKIVLLLQIIAHCDLIGDKVVVFSQCLNTLSFIEGIIQSDDWGGFKPHLPNNICQQKLGGWKKNREYLRIDGSVDAKERGDIISSFNSSDNQHTRLFLLSTLAGGLGVNLVAANRVVLFDSHWNPTVDLQAVYRCYRYGQTKPTYCYRLLGEGSMEEKIYSRAAAKASLSNLVIDKKNPERSFTKKEMDLLQLENNWLCCDWCDKWRMLRPGLSAEEVEKQTSMDSWCCEDNIYDEDRQCCEAKERDQAWMMKYWEKRVRQEEGINNSQSQSQSQSQNEASQNNETLPTSTEDDERREELTERDEVLQTLLSRTEERSANTKGANNSSNKTSSMSWISKYAFVKEQIEDDESKKAAEAKPTSVVAAAVAAAPKSKASSPKKTLSSPKTKVKPQSKKNAKSPAKKNGQSPKKNGKSPAKKNGQSSKKNGKSPAKKNGKSPAKKNGTSSTRIDNHFSPKKNGSSANVKAESTAAAAPTPRRSPPRLGDRKRKRGREESPEESELKQPSKKQKEEVIDLCLSDSD